MFCVLNLYLYSISCLSHYAGRLKTTATSNDTVDSQVKSLDPDASSVLYFTE